MYNNVLQAKRELSELFFISRRSRENYFQDFFGFPRFARTAGKNDFQDFQDFARLRAGNKTAPKTPPKPPKSPLVTRCFPAPITYQSSL